MRKILPLLCFIFFASNVQSQNYQDDYSSNVSSIDSIVTSIYQVISGDKGEERNWDLHKTIFHPEARIISNYVDEEGKYQISFFTVDEYMNQFRDYFKENNTYEKDVNRVIEIFGNMAHVFSTFESYRNAEDSTPYKLGTASIQLYNDGDRWYVLNMYYKNESENDKVPNKYIPSQ
jgi:hypothetical protein